MQTQVVSAESEINKELGAFGIPESALRESVEASERLRLGMNPNHPPMAHGFIPWSELVCALRDQLIPLGWTKNDEGNLPRIIHPNGNLAIAVLTGDENTGIIEEPLRSKYPRGPRSRSLIEGNAEQLELGDLGYMVKALPFPETKTLLWYLMLRRTPSGVRFELSLPYAVGIDGRVVGWKKRLVFKPVVIEQDIVGLESNSESTQDIDIEITSKV